MTYEEGHSTEHNHLLTGEIFLINDIKINMSTPYKMLSTEQSLLPQSSACTELYNPDVIKMPVLFFEIAPFCSLTFQKVIHDSDPWESTLLTILTQ